MTDLNEEYLVQLIEDSKSGCGRIELSDRDAACLVLPNLDYDSQLAAIHHLLSRHREADQGLEREIAEIETFARRTSGLRNQHAIDEWTDRLHHSIYQDTAHSMAAVGMLAPLIESVFYQTFQGIRQRFYDGKHAPTDHARWQQPAEDQWDCHFYWSKGRRSTNLVSGILQISEALGLTSHLPQHLKHTLEALFEYRNKMFHCGFEWPIYERQRFARRITDAGWPAVWFAQARRGDEPWVFYMTNEFIQHCADMIDRVICGVGAYCKFRFIREFRERRP